MRWLGSATAADTATASALPVSAAEDSTPVGAPRLPSGLMPRRIESKSLMPSWFVSCEFGLVPIANLMLSGRPLPLVSGAVLARKLACVNIVVLPLGAVVSQASATRPLTGSKMV